MKKTIIFLCLFLVVALAFFLRVNKVTEVPPSLNWDEVSIGYNAYSILKTGKDEWGKSYPIHFKSYGEYKLPAQIYFSIPAIAIFGLNDFGIRITPVIYGTLTVLLLFFLAKELFKNDYISLIASLLLAISPWHIQLTRASFESSFSVFWIILGFLLLIKGFRKRIYLILAAIPLVVSVYTYNSARIFTPLFLVVIFLIYHKFFLANKKILIFAIALFAILLLPLAPYYLSGSGNSRYRLVSVTDDPGLLPRINETRGNSHLPSPLPRLLYNKVTFVSLAISEHYLAHFTPDFLFISGAPHKQHHVQDMGELFLFQAPFLLIGLYLLFKKKQQFRYLLIAWVLISIVPVSVTNDSIPHALRTLIAAPFYQLITAYGLYYTFMWLKNKNNYYSYILVAVVLAIGSINFYNYLNNYYNIYPIKYSRDWQYGYKQVVDYIKDNQQKYDLIVFSRNYGEPHMFTLFYLNYDPAKFQNNPNLVRFETYNWIRVLKFDKYYFPDLGDQGTMYQDVLNESPTKKILFIGKPGDFPQSLSKLKTVNFLNGNKAFEIVEKQ